jgi:hypothetical protein
LDEVARVFGQGGVPPLCHLLIHNGLHGGDVGVDGQVCGGGDTSVCLQSKEKWHTWGFQGAR